MCGSDCFLMLLSVLFPPVGVWIKKGLCSADSLINLALCCLGFLPGLLHAWYIILQNPDPYDSSYQSLPNSHDAEHGPAGRHGRVGGTTTYYVVTHEQPSAGPGAHGGAMGGARNYGTVPAQQPSAGQFPGQMKGSTPPANGAGGEGQGQGSSSSQPEEAPPTYADAVKGDNKVQGP